MSYQLMNGQRAGENELGASPLARAFRPAIQSARQFLKGAAAAGARGEAIAPPVIQVTPAGVARQVQQQGLTPAQLQQLFARMGGGGGSPVPDGFSPPAPRSFLRLIPTKGGSSPVMLLALGAVAIVLLKRRKGR